MPISRFRLLCVAALAVAGCAGPIQRSPEGATPVLADLRTVQNNPEEYEGMYLVLGGEILETRVESDGTALVVLEQPLNRRQRPERSDETAGRVVVWYGDYLDPHLFRRGRRVTVGGLVGGTQEEPVGETLYPHLLVYGKEVHLWEEPDRPLISELAKPREWYPWWYDPYFGSRAWWW